MATFDENGNYVKTTWKGGDKITAAKLNKIEESLEAINNNDISRHVEADARLDKLESGTVSDKQELNAKIDALEDVVEANKDGLDLEVYSINAHMTLLDKKIDDGVAEVEAIANTVDGKIAAADASMKAQVNQGKADMEAMVAEVEGELDGLHAKGDELLNKIEYIENNVLDFGLINDGDTDNAPLLNSLLNLDNKSNIYKFPKGVYKFIVDSEDKVIKLKTNTKLIFEKGSVVKFGIDQSPYFPLFWLDNVDSVEIDGLNICYTGDFEPIDGEASVTKLGVTAKERAFATIIGVKNATNCIIKNVVCYGETDANVYDAFLRGFGSHFNNSIVDNITLSHYNNGFSDGLTNCIIQNIKGLVRSNKSNNTDSNAFYGPSHLFYASLNNSFVSNIFEIGRSLDDGKHGGATCQFTASNNLIAKNINTNMKNTPAVFLKHVEGKSINNVTVENVMCDCADWDDNAEVECCVGTITNFNGYNCTFNNVNIFTRDKNVTALSLSGRNCFYKDIKITSESTGSETFPLASLITLQDSFVDITIINNDNSRPCMYISGSHRNDVKYSYKGNGIDNFGVHPHYNDRNWGGCNNNDISINTLSNAQYREFTGLTIYEIQNNFFTKSKVYSLQKTYTVETAATNMSTSMDLPRNGTYLMNVNVSSGDMNHAKNETYVVIIDNRSANDFLNAACIASFGKGDISNNCEITVAPNLREGVVPNINITATSTRNMLNRIYIGVILLTNFYN